MLFRLAGKTLVLGLRIKRYIISLTLIPETLHAEQALRFCTLDTKSDCNSNLELYVCKHSEKSTPKSTDLHHTLLTILDGTRKGVSTETNGDSGTDWILEPKLIRKLAQLDKNRLHRRERNPIRAPMHTGRGTENTEKSRLWKWS
jgi:hypothetical protein